MAKIDAVYLCVWSGNARHALDIASGRFPGVDISEFPHRKLRMGGVRQRIRLLRGIRGKAIIFYFESLDSFKHRRVLECFHTLHKCQKTILCDGSGRWETIRNADIPRAAVGVVLSIVLDVKTLIFWWCYLRLWPKRAAPRVVKGNNGPAIAYLIPNPASLGSGGGAISHIRGFLSGLKAAEIPCNVFSGTALAQDFFRNEVIHAARRTHFFWGAAMLSYNFVFARSVQRHLTVHRPQFLYQRHFAFSVAGVLLSKRLQVPLILEYNGPEAWIAEHWDPSPLRSWIKMCEQVSLQCAARIVVVSEVLRVQLLGEGISADRIRMNPNSVDAEFFFPGRGRESGRRQLNVGPDEVLVGFVGSFSLWHGIEVLQQAIRILLSNQKVCNLRFVLMGDGLLHGEMRVALAEYESSGKVVFTGLLSRDMVAEYLDASDILVSPHIPMPDGSRFFGSPTKIFEYMAMGKGIVASRLEQIADVLEHDRTAWLVTPGNVEELAQAVLQLALNPAKRVALGAAARYDAVHHHSWTQNVASALSDLPTRQDESMTLSEASPRSTEISG